MATTLCSHLGFIVAPRVVLLCSTVSQQEMKKWGRKEKEEDLPRKGLAPGMAFVVYPKSKIVGGPCGSKYHSRASSSGAAESNKTFPRTKKKKTKIC